MDENKITKEYLHSLFAYSDGKLYWKSPKQAIQVGDEAGCVRRSGYVIITINQKSYQAHRLIYLMHYGDTPKMVDHIDNNPRNNRIENLRAATTHTNQYNTKLSERNTSGVKNVCWHKGKHRWMVKIKANGTFHYLGYYKDLESAKLKASEARQLLHKEFARG